MPAWRSLRSGRHPCGRVRVQERYERTSSSGSSSPALSFFANSAIGSLPRNAGGAECGRKAASDKDSRGPIPRCRMSAWSARSQQELRIGPLPRTDGPAAFRVRGRGNTLLGYFRSQEFRRPTNSRTRRRNRSAGSRPRTDRAPSISDGESLHAEARDAGPHTRGSPPVGWASGSGGQLPQVQLSPHLHGLQVQPPVSFMAHPLRRVGLASTDLPTIPPGGVWLDPRQRQRILVGTDRAVPARWGRTRPSVDREGPTAGGRQGQLRPADRSAPMRVAPLTPIHANRWAGQG